MSMNSTEVNPEVVSVSIDAVEQVLSELEEMGLPRNNDDSYTAIKRLLKSSTRLIARRKDRTPSRPGYITINFTRNPAAVH